MKVSFGLMGCCQKVGVILHLGINFYLGGRRNGTGSSRSSCSCEPQEGVVPSFFPVCTLTFGRSDFIRITVTSPDVGDSGVVNVREESTVAREV